MYDQAVATTDRSGRPATLSGRQFRLFFHSSANQNTIYDALSTPFCGYCVLVATGPPARWRNLPYEDLPWQSVYYYFHRWKMDGTFEKLNAALNQWDRLRTQPEALPSAVCVDSQSVKLSPMIWEDRGLDVHKRVNGRKRQLIVDTQGRIWVVIVPAAHEADGPAATALIATLLWRVGERLEKVYGDQAYNGVFAHALADWSIDFEKASRPESERGFVPVAKRWVVERTIGWTNRSGDPVLSAHC